MELLSLKAQCNTYLHKNKSFKIIILMVNLKPNYIYFIAAAWSDYLLLPHKPLHMTSSSHLAASEHISVSTL